METKGLIRRIISHSGCHVPNRLTVLFLMSRHTHTRILSLLLIFWTLVCSGSGSIKIGPPPQGSGQVTLKLTDFPVSGRDISQVNVQIMTIEVQQSGWNTVINFGATGRIFDLLLLQNGNTVELGAFNLPVGNYNQIRMVLGTQNTVLVNEGSGYVVKPLQTPSGQGAGIKIMGGFSITEQGTTTLMLDFDASQSVKYAGNKYQLNPTIRVLSVDTSQSYFALAPVSIAGQTLTPSLASGVAINTSFAPNGIMAAKSISVGNNVVLNANLYVLGACTTDCLTANQELSTGLAVVLNSTRTMRANRMSLGNNTNIHGGIQYNSLSLGSGVTIASQSTPPGDMPAVPDFLKGQLGLTNITQANSPLAPGFYYSINVAASQTLNLSGGNYHIDSITLNSGATLKCLDACMLMTKTFVTTATGATITAANNDPNYFYIFVSNGSPAPATQPYVSIGSNNTIRADFHVPYATFNLGSGTAFTGFIFADRVNIGSSATITGSAAGVAFSGDYATQGTYKGTALIYHFKGDSNQMRMVSSNYPQYIFHGLYQYNIITKQGFITYDTVDLVDPDCIPCQSTGIYPPIATYPADTFYINPAFTGFEVLSYTNIMAMVWILSDNTTVQMNRRSVFGPFDEVAP